MVNDSVLCRSRSGDADDESDAGNESHLWLQFQSYIAEGFMAPLQYPEQRWAATIVGWTPCATRASASWMSALRPGSWCLSQSRNSRARQTGYSKGRLTP